MFNLILQDLRKSKKIAYLLIIYTFILLYAFQSLGESAFIAIVVAIAYMLMSKACAPDHLNKSETLPDKSEQTLSNSVTRQEDIVGAKYFAIFVYGLFGTGAYLFAVATFQLMGIAIKISSLDFMSIAIMFFALGTMASLYYPLYFKSGYAKSSKYGIIIFSFFFFTPPLILGLVHAEMTPQVGQGLLQWLQAQSPFTIGLALILLTLLILTSSYRYSVKVYLKYKV